MSSYRSQDSANLADVVAAAAPSPAALPGVPDVQHRQRGWRERSLWRYLMAAVVLAVLHLPFLFVKMPVDKENAVSSVSLPEIVSLPQPSGEYTPQEPENALAELYSWLKLANPAQWFFPDDTIGFAAANKPFARPGEPPLPQYLPPGYPLEKYLFAEKKLETAAMSIPECSAALWMPLVVEEHTEPETPSSYPPANHAQIWRLADGSVLANPPKLDAEGLKVWSEAATREFLDSCFKTEGLLACGDGCTWLEVHFGEVPAALLSASVTERRVRMPLPRITVCQSCGVPALDAAALRALRHYLREAYAGDKVPLPGSVLLCVSW